MTPDQTKVILAQISEACLCGWPVVPEIELRDGRLFLNWACPICSADWEHYERVPVDMVPSQERKLAAESPASLVMTPLAGRWLQRRWRLVAHIWSRRD